MKYLADNNESISSINMIAGFLSLAIVKRVLINLYNVLANNIWITKYFSDSPTHFDIKSDEDIAKNVASASVAHALAKKVFPVPGG